MMGGGRSWAGRVWCGYREVGSSSFRGRRPRIHRGCCSNVLLYAGALWGMIREAAKASKEKRAVKPEPYVEREDMNGEKWRQMQKNGMLVPDKFYRA